MFDNPPVRYQNLDLCLSANYVRRSVPAFHDDRNLKDEYQDRVYAYAREIADKENLATIVDLGCGSAYKLLKYFNDRATHGVDLPRTVEWLVETYPQRSWGTAEESDGYAQLVICADMIEHVENPVSVLEFIKEFKPRKIILSTPARDLLEDGFEGPPTNLCHVQEWTFLEFRKFVESAGYHVDAHFIADEEEACQVIEAHL